MLALVLAVGELTLRTVVGYRAAHAVRSAIGGNVSVDLGGAPALVDALTQSIPALSIHATHVTMCPLKNVTVEATLEDVHRHGGALAVSGSHVQALVPPEALGALLNKGGGGAAVAVIPDPTQQVLHVRVGPGGLVNLSERPELVGNAMRFTPVGASLGGLALPVGMLSQIMGNTAAAQVTLPTLPLGMTAETVQVTPAGVEVSASGPAAQARGGSGAFTSARC